MNPLYDHLVKNNTKTISDHELSRWPMVQVEQLKNEKLLKKGKIGKRIYCDGCEENCPIDDYEVIEIPGKGQKAAFVCPEKEEMGFQTVSLSRRRQWRFMQPKKRKKVSEVAVKKSEVNEPPGIEKTFFVFLGDGIAFYSKGEFRKLPFQPERHVFKVLPKFIDSSMTSDEVQKYAESNDKARSIVHNINRSILSRLKKAEFSGIDCKKFVYYDDTAHSYQIKFPIITHEQYKVLRAKLSGTYYGG